MENMEENDGEGLNNINLDESIKIYINDLKNKLFLVMKENNQLKMEHSQIINNNQYFMRIKKQNNFLLQKIKELQLQNKEISNNINMVNNIESNTEIIELNNKINEYEMFISKINLEKKLLEKKIENLIKDNQNEKNLMIKLKNNEILSYKKTINDLKNKEKNNINNLNINKKMYNDKIEQDSKFYLDKINILEQNNDKLSEDLFMIEKENKNLKNQIENINLNLKYKDNIIQNLNEKIHSFSNDYNRQVNSLEKNNSQSQFQVQQLFMENDKLKKENNELNMGIKLINEKVEDSIAIFNNKNDQFNLVVQNYKTKLKEYKTKIILLKKRIDELLLINNNYNKYNMRKDNSTILKHNMSSILPNKGSFSQGKLNFAYGSNFI